MNKRFAQIKDGKVHFIYQCEKKPNFPDKVVMVDITGLSPAPTEGWAYDRDNKTFNPPQCKIVETQPSEMIFLKVSLLKNDTSHPFGILNDNIDSVQISIDLYKLTDNQFEIADYSGPLKLKFDSGIGIGDLVQVSITNGKAIVDFTTNMPPSIYTILGFETIVLNDQVYQINNLLPTENIFPTQLTVYRIL